MRVVTTSLLFFSLLGVTHAAASPCGDKVAALEKKLNANGASSDGAASNQANARTVKSREVIENAKAADQRGDVKECETTLDKAMRETGSAQH